MPTEVLRCKVDVRRPEVFFKAICSLVVPGIETNRAPGFCASQPASGGLRGSPSSFRGNLPRRSTNKLFSSHG